MAHAVTAAVMLSGPVALKRSSSVWRVTPTEFNTCSLEVERTTLCAAEVLQTIIAYGTL